MNTLQLFEKNKEYDIMETGQLVKEQSWVPGMGVALPPSASRGMG